MDAVNEYIRELLAWLPKEVILSIFIVVIFSEATKKLVSKLEEYLENKYQRQIKIFDHTKVIFVTIWSLVATVTLVIAKVLTWSVFPLYFMAIFGASVIFYEYILKRLNKLWE